MIELFDTLVKSLSFCLSFSNACLHSLHFLNKTIFKQIAYRLQISSPCSQAQARHKVILDHNLIDVLDRYSLKQHVCKPTHVGGNLLDVIATPDNDASFVSHHHM